MLLRKLLLVLVAATAPASALSCQSLNIGGGHPGANGVPYLSATGTFADGDDILFTLVNGSPNAPAIFVSGLSIVNVPLFGGILIPNPEATPNIVLDALGQASVVVPTSTSWIGIDVYYQVLTYDLGAAGEWSFSNAVHTVVQDNPVAQVECSTDGGDTWSAVSGAATISGYAYQLSTVGVDDYYGVMLDVQGVETIYRIHWGDINAASKGVWEAAFLPASSGMVSVTWDSDAQFTGVQ